MFELSEWVQSSVGQYQDVNRPGAGTEKCAVQVSMCARTWPCSLEQRSFQSQPPGWPATLTGQSQDHTHSFDWNTSCFNSSIQILISCHTWLPIPRRDFEEEQSAPLPTSFTAPTKAIHNDGPGHGGDQVADAEETDSESNANVEKEFDGSTGMQAWEKVSTFVCNVSIQASWFSTTFFAYV